MARPTKEMQAERAAAAEWRKALADHAQGTVRAALEEGAGLVLADDPGGGLTVEILGPDGEWRRYFVRLTETGPYSPVVLP